MSMRVSRVFFQPIKYSLQTYRLVFKFQPFNVLYYIGPVSSIQEPDVPTTLQSPSEKGSFKYDDAPPIPKPRKLQKGSSSVDSLNEGIEVPSHYDVPCDIPRKDSPEPNPIYEVIPEDVPTNYENVSDTKFKQIVSGEEKYQNL